MNVIQSKNLFPQMQKYMFNKVNMNKGYNLIRGAVDVPAATTRALVPAAITATHVPATLATAAHATAAHATAAHATAAHATTHALVPEKKEKQTKPFTPFQKDKLFWCFFILLRGHDEYEMNRSNAFSLEKKIKIETVEKLKSIKEKLKELKLKRTEIEDNLVNQPVLSLKGLSALCLVHNISITYIYGRKYCEINTQDSNIERKKGIIIQNAKKEDSLCWQEDATEAFMADIKANYWFIENIQKPLNAPSAYSLKDLQDICQKLHIELETTLNEKTKLKTKSKLYEDILTQLC